MKAAGEVHLMTAMRHAASPSMLADRESPHTVEKTPHAVLRRELR